MHKTVATVISVVCSFVLHGDAYGAAQTKGQQKCINGINKGMAKIAGLSLKAYAKCTATSAKEGPIDVYTCAQSDEKVTEAKADLIDQQPTLCVETPDFAYTSATGAGNTVTTATNQLTSEIFGSPIESAVTSCSTDSAGCKCQSAIYKAVTKLFQAELKAYNRCKKDGLKAEVPFDAAADLVACITADPQLAIDKAEARLQSTIASKCEGVAAPFTTVSGWCDNLTGSALLTCLVTRTKCHTCTIEVFGDALGVDCDPLDNGIDDSSCLAFE